MKTMKDQVTSIEQSKRLIDLGVPAEKASMVWYPVVAYTGNGFEMKLTGEYDLYSKDRVSPQYQNVIFKAFTVADLLEKVLPNVIQDAHNTYELTLKAVVGGGWRFCYTPVLTPLEADNIGDEMGDNLIELLCRRIEWIVSNGYKLNI